jgi:polyphosphate glucokinase
MAEPRIAIGVDVGGSGIKAAVVDAGDGRFVSDRLRVPTPSPSTPEAVSASIGRLVKRLVSATGIGPEVPIGLGLPGVVLQGVLKTAANIDPTWVEFPITQRLGKSLKRPVTVVNDADAAGTAEMRFGIGTGRQGVVVLLTLGTGVGSAVFIDGKLVPNTEFGQMEIRGRPAERRSASVARTKRGLSWKAWSQDLDEHLIRIDELIWPELFILGGGVSKNFEKYGPRLTVRPPVVAAQLRNDAGIIGAAVIAAEAAERAAAEPPDTEPVPVAAGVDAENGVS